MVFCPEHWNLLPQRLKDPVWHEYAEGYEKGTHPSPLYKSALGAARDWLEENYEMVHSQASKW